MFIYTYDIRLFFAHKILKGMKGKKAKYKIKNNNKEKEKKDIKIRAKKNTSLWGREKKSFLLKTKRVSRNECHIAWLRTNVSLLSIKIKMECRDSSI